MTVWDARARLYDVLEASDLRRATPKRALFARMEGRTLFVAIGTGLDIAHFPAGRDITAIDISETMLARARARQHRYGDGLRLERHDAAALPYADASFDTVATSCTLCSVPDPRRVLGELLRVLRPGGRFLLFEHVRSRHVALALVLDLMSLWSRRSGTDMSRDTIAAVTSAGFEILSVESVFVDIILAVEARRPVAD